MKYIFVLDVHARNFGTYIRAHIWGKYELVFLQELNLKQQQPSSSSWSRARTSTCLPGESFGY
eukprot:09969.XXX_118001_118189_1 [CDS] Oithona nana genome sequencing.